MKVADRITLFRITLAPIFFILYMMPVYFPVQFKGTAIWLLPLTWVIAITAEITDYFDGFAARNLKQSSDFGKLFDPFADTLLQLTAFLCFVIDGILPAVLFLVIIYREFGILFIRNLMLRKGITMGARMSGKIKTVTYICAAAFCLAYTSICRLGILAFIQPYAKITALVVFCISVLFSVISFFDYIRVYLAAQKAAD